MLAKAAEHYENASVCRLGYLLDQTNPEDIDLVQAQAEPIGTTVDAIRDALSWLGRCNREQAGRSMYGGCVQKPV